MLNHQKRLHTQYSEGNSSIRDIANMVMDPTSSECPPLVFVSVSPPLHKQGFQHMSFPVDVKIETWCHTNHRSTLDEVIASFRQLDRSFTYTEEQFQGDFSPFLKPLMDNGWRTAFIEDTKITGILWDEHEIGRAS